MSYCCTYELLDKNKNVLKSRTFTACFSGDYNNFQGYSFIKYYIFKDYEEINYQGSNHNCYSKSDILKYVKILEQFGTKIEVNTDDILRSGDNKYEVYSFIIPIENALLVKILLNMIRYLHEQEGYMKYRKSYNNRDFINIPKTLIAIDKNIKTMNILNKVILAHYISNSLSGGHDITGNDRWLKLYTKKEYDKLFDTNKAYWDINVCNTLTKGGIFMNKNEVKPLLKQGKYVKAYKLYRKKLKPVKKKESPKPFDGLKDVKWAMEILDEVPF